MINYFITVARLTLEISKFKKFSLQMNPLKIIFLLRKKREKDKLRKAISYPKRIPFNILLRILLNKKNS